MSIEYLSPRPSVDDQRLIAARREQIQRIVLLGLAALFSVVVLLASNIYLANPSLVPMAMFLLFAVVLIGIIIWHYPEIAIYSILFATLMFEQWQIRLLNPLTSQTHFFETISGATSHRVPIHFSPAEIFIGLTLLTVLIQAFARRRTDLYLGGLFIPMMVFFSAVVFSFVYGYVAEPANRGWENEFNHKAAWVEARSFVYLVICYFLAINLINNRRRLKLFTWVLIGALAIKGFQGVDRYITKRRWNMELETITGHEDVVFFSAYFVLLGGLMLFGGDRRQKIAMLLLAPPLGFTIFATTRRMAFFVMGIAILMVGIALIRERPHLFKKIAPVALVGVIVYTGVFWNQPNTLPGQPVRAFRSQLGFTSQRDEQSDVWRDLENQNIVENIRSAPVTGLGFGRQYRFYVDQPTLEGTGFVYWVYITHNAIYWVWMKMGLFGFIAFWWMVGAGTVLGIMTFRKLEDGYLKTIALTAATVAVMQIIFSYGDLGLTYARSMMFLGLMLGVMARLLDIAEREPEPPDEPAAEGATP